MARKKVEVLEEEHVQAAGDGWQPEPEKVRVVQPDEDTELESIFSDFPQNEACIELFRIKPQGGHPLFLEQITPIMFSLAYVKETWGGGRYQAKGRYSNGEKKRMPFEIAGDPKAEVRATHKAEPIQATPFQFAPQPEIPQVSSGSELQQALMMMMQQMVKQSQNSEMQMLEKMKMYKDLFATAPGPAAPLDQALNMFQRGVELATMNTGGEGGGPNFWMQAIKELKEPLTQLFGVVQTAMTAKPPQQINPIIRPNPIAGGPVPVQVSTPPTEQPSSEGGEMNMGVIGLVKAMMPNLVTAAAKNADPEFYAGFILDQVPESAYNALQKFLAEPDSLDKLAFLEPAIRYQADWWQELRSQLLIAIKGELSGDSNSVPTQNQQPTARHATDSQESID